MAEPTTLQAAPSATASTSNKFVLEDLILSQQHTSSLLDTTSMQDPTTHRILQEDIPVEEYVSSEDDGDDVLQPRPTKADASNTLDGKPASSSSKLRSADIDRGLNDLIRQLKIHQQQAAPATADGAQPQSSTTNGQLPSPLSSLHHLFNSQQLPQTATTLHNEYQKLTSQQQQAFLQELQQSLSAGSANNTAVNTPSTSELHSHYQQQLSNSQQLIQQTITLYSKYQKQRNYHQLHHRRVVQEKNLLLKDLQRCKALISQHSQIVESLTSKYTIVSKEKNLIKMEREKLKAKVEKLQSELKVQQQQSSSSGADGADKASDVNEEKEIDPNEQTGKFTVEQTTLQTRQRNNTTKKPKGEWSTVGMGKTTTAKATTHLNDSQLPTDVNANSAIIQQAYAYQSQLPTLPVQQYRSFVNMHTQHTAAVSAVSVHPTKPLCATGSDDHGWKLWALPTAESLAMIQQQMAMQQPAGQLGCELLLSVDESHQDWLSSVDFHPSGQLLATASGDSTIKVWNLLECGNTLNENGQPTSPPTSSLTFTEHTQAVWSLSHHASGDWLLSSSMDHTAKLWDLHSQRCRQTFRGHVDSVNCVAWQPFSSLFATASGDKTVSLWDTRASTAQKSACSVTYYGHTNAVFSVAYDACGVQLASSDADGVVRLWDTRNSTECIQSYASQDGRPINSIKFDASGRLLVGGSDNGSIYVYDTHNNGQHSGNGLNGSVVGSLEGHTDSVLSVAFDPATQALLSVSSDLTVRLWA